MAKPSKKKSKSEDVGFDADEQLPDQSKSPKRVLPKGDIKNHAKFDKFKKGNN
jgi:hypothetical protein